MNISQFTYKDITIDVTHNNGYLSYSFEYEGSPYGYKLKPQGKKTMDIVNATFLLIISAIDTYENLHTK